MAQGGQDSSLDLKSSISDTGMYENCISSTPFVLKFNDMKLQAFRWVSRGEHLNTLHKELIECLNEVSLKI